MNIFSKNNYFVRIFDTQNMGIGTIFVERDSHLYLINLNHARYACRYNHLHFNKQEKLSSKKIVFGVLNYDKKRPSGESNGFLSEVFFVSFALLDRNKRESNFDY
jgi:hypothetical protein